MMIAIPPKYAVSQVIGFIESAIHLARVDSISGPAGTSSRRSVIRECIKNQEQEDERLEQLGLWA